MTHNFNYRKSLGENRKALLLGVAVSAISLMSISAAFAKVDEITVTATKTGESSLQETPLAITAFTSDMLDKTAMSDVRDLEQLTPGLTISENTGYAQIYIRGVGSNNVFLGADPSSTIHIDGVYIARPQASFNNFLDVERIEVVRGPQGTLYGRNSVGGTINVISRKPSLDEVKYKVQGTAGNFDLWRGEGYLSAPIIKDRFAVSVAGQISKRDGYRENISLIGNDLDDEDSVILKGQALFNISDSIEAIVRADYYDEDSAAAGFSTLLIPSPAPLANTILGDFDKVAHNAPTSYDRENWGVSLELNADLNEMWSVKSLTAYRENDVLVSVDSDASEIDILRTQLAENQDQFTQELNLIGNFDRGSLLLGAYYIDEHIDAAGGAEGVSIIGLGLSVRPEPIVDTSAWAVFGQATFDVTDQLSFTAGIRYTDEEKDFTKNHGLFVTGTSIEVVPLSFPKETGKYSAVTPKFGIDFQATENVLLYASVTRGFKSGGFNFTASVPGGYDEETMWAYEAGVKSDLADDRLRVNLAGFYYDYKDLQVQSFITPGSIDVKNAATAKVHGVELEATATPTSELDLFFNVAYLNAEYDKYPGALIAGGAVIDASGNTLNNSPEWSGSVGGQYTHDLNWGAIFAGASYSWKSEVFFTADNNAVERQKSFGLLNASVGVESPDGRIRLTVFGRNITDEEYVTATANFTVVPSGHVGSPATYGVRLSFSN